MLRCAWRSIVKSYSSETAWALKGVCSCLGKLEVVLDVRRQLILPKVLMGGGLVTVRCADDAIEGAAGQAGDLVLQGLVAQEVLLVQPGLIGRRGVHREFWRRL